MIIESIRRETLIPSPAPGAGVGGALYYTRTSGTDMFCVYGIETRSDLCDGAYTKLSTDNGRTWSEPITVSGDGIGGDLGYPSTVQLDDGSLVSAWYEKMKGSPSAVLRQARWSIRS